MARTVTLASGLARTRGCSEQCHTVGTKLDDVVHHSILYGVKP